MKKLMALLILLTLIVGGCAGFKAAVCSPTADQVMYYSDQIAQASASLAFLQTLAPTIPIAAIIAGLQMSISIFKQARDGICVPQEQLAAAKTQVNSGVVYSMQLKKTMKKK